MGTGQIASASCQQPSKRDKVRQSQKGRFSDHAVRGQYLIQRFTER
jgi:hypothetical protein